MIPGMFKNPIHVVLASVAMFSPMAAVAEESVVLFNGKDLAGWTFDDGKVADAWSVKDGLLVCTGEPQGAIRTEKDYGNYELILEWRWAAGSDGGNSGLLVHTSTPNEVGIWPKCLEVQLGSGNAGDFWMLGVTTEVAGAGAQGRRWTKLVEGAEKDAGEWNVMKVRCEGDAITVWVNDKEVNRGAKTSAVSGAIAFQSEGSEIHFRKVELKPLK